MFSRSAPLWALFLAVLFASCSSLKRAAVGTTASLLYEATPAVEAESDFDLFKESVLANIKVMEGLLSVSPNDEDLLAALTKAYAGYGFGVYETMDLEDAIKDRRDRPWKERAMLFYSRAIFYGERYLQINDVTFKGLLSNLRDSKGQEYLNHALAEKEKRDREVALFTAQSLAGLINYQRDSMVMVGQLPIAKALFDWGCHYDSSINYGACDLFYGAYYAGRPKMLGGDAKKGREYFEAAVTKYPDNYLIDAAFLQYYAMPMLDEEIYQKIKVKVMKAAGEFNQMKYWSPMGEEKSSKPYALYQAIGLKRALTIIKLEKDWM